MMLHQPRNIGFVFQQKYGLAQPDCLSPAEGWISSPYRQSQLNTVEECKRRSESLTE
jgi:hypothetical protein